MALNERLSFWVPESYDQSRVIVVDGFGQAEGDRVTHDIPDSFQASFPGINVDAPIPMAETLSEDTTLQLSFDEQAKRVKAAIEASDQPAHLYAFSQGGMATAEVLASEDFENVETVTFVGTPLDAEYEQERIARLEASDMGGMFEYVAAQLPARMGDAALQGVVRFAPRKGDPRYVGITDGYMASFPSTGRHLKNLAAVAETYHTTLVSAGAEEMTDCTPVNARTFGRTVDMPFTSNPRELDWQHQRQGFVIEGANHRLGEHHRAVTIPRIYRLRTHLADRALLAMAS